jgi:hypothetical protein
LVSILAPLSSSPSTIKYKFETTLFTIIYVFHPTMIGENHYITEVS